MSERCWSFCIADVTLFFGSKDGAIFASSMRFSSLLFYVCVRGQDKNTRTEKTTRGSVRVLYDATRVVVPFFVARGAFLLQSVITTALAENGR
jgi:hypothetical protein